MHESSGQKKAKKNILQTKFPAIQNIACTLTFGLSVVRVYPPVVHVHNVDPLIVDEVSLVAIALVSIKVNNHNLTDPLQVLEHKLHVVTQERQTKKILKQ